MASAMKAVCMVREAPHYRRDAILKGLKEAGLEIVPKLDRPKPGDLVVVWNRYGNYETEALRFEAAGAAVIVMENGYLGHREDEFRKLFSTNGEQLYAMALDHHNGAGRWYVGERGRWREQGIEVKPWRETGEHILVLAAARDWASRCGNARRMAREGRSAAQDADRSARW